MTYTLRFGWKCKKLMKLLKNYEQIAKKTAVWQSLIDTQVNNN